MGDIDFKAASRDGFDVDWPVSYEEIAPYYSRVERMMGVASTVQNRLSNPDGEYLPPMKLRCIDYILQKGCGKLGVPYLPDRLAQLTVPHEGHPACHYCGNCTEGCDTGSFFSTPWFFLPPAEKTGNLELRTNAVVKDVLVDENGRATGVAYIDRISKQEVEVRGKAIVMAASCIESARILLNSKSRRFPTGLANSSGQLGRNLRDHLYGTTGYGYLPQLLGQPSFPDNVSSSQVVWMPRWQNLNHPHEEKFIRGYSIYPTGGCCEFPWYQRHLEGFGSELKRDIKRYYPTPVSFYCQIPSLPSPTNFVDIDPEMKDIYGIPAVRVHFQWGPNELLMWEQAKQVCPNVIKASGGEVWGVGERPNTPGGVCTKPVPAAWATIQRNLSRIASDKPMTSQTSTLATPASFSIARTRPPRFRFSHFPCGPRSTSWNRCGGRKLLPDARRRVGMACWICGRPSHLSDPAGIPTCVGPKGLN
jgi:choline dehydrogenase-like flavoprotein